MNNLVNAKFLIGHCLSYTVVFGASILKLPQILNIYRRRSASGISITSNYIELFAYVVSTSWGIVHKFPFRDFGENGLILVQLVVLNIMVANFQKKTRITSAVLAVYLILFSLLSKGYVSRGAHECLLSSLILLNVCSRVPQIFLNFKNKSTGQLSFLTFFLAFGGGVARMMTTMLNVPWEKGKFIILSQFSMAALLNFIVIFQILYYAQKKRVKRT
ncbi:unnamed protein product [Phytomonas sp. Hart1]|nr:unnamed protein product [Phytomonas sp. Hart1]|eukprot:CCW67872.1 unnamed protein product [Phytomonas sp. isolate Hart1]